MVKILREFLTEGDLINQKDLEIELIPLSVIYR
jgi:hypothetical protein